MPGGGRVRTYSNRKKGQPAKGKTKPVVTESTSSQIQGSGFKSKDDANDMDHSPQKTKPADELVAILDNMPGVDILANIQKFSVHPLLVASSMGHELGIQKLLEEKVDINTQDPNDGNSPLHVAAAAGQVEAINLLVKNNADLNITNKEGNTPFMVAVNRNKHEAVNALWSHRSKMINIDHKNMNGQTVLHLAADKSLDSVIKALCRTNINKNLKDNHGVTALMITARRGSIKCAKLLVESGANILVSAKPPSNSSISNNITAVCTAVLKSRMDVAKMLIEYLTLQNLISHYIESRLTIMDRITNLEGNIAFLHSMCLPALLLIWRFEDSRRCLMKYDFYKSMIHIGKLFLDHKTTDVNFIDDTFHYLCQCMILKDNGSVSEEAVEMFLTNEGPELVLAAMHKHGAALDGVMGLYYITPLIPMVLTKPGRDWLVKNYHKILSPIGCGFTIKDVAELDDARQIKDELLKLVPLWPRFLAVFKSVQSHQSDRHFKELIASEKMAKEQESRRKQRMEKQKMKQVNQKDLVIKTSSQSSLSDDKSERDDSSTLTGLETTQTGYTYLPENKSVMQKFEMVVPKKDKKKRTKGLVSEVLKNCDKINDEESTVIVKNHKDIEISHVPDTTPKSLKQAHEPKVSSMNKTTTLCKEQNQCIKQKLENMNEKHSIATKTPAKLNSVIVPTKIDDRVHMMTVLKPDKNKSPMSVPNNIESSFSTLLCEDDENNCKNFAERSANEQKPIDSESHTLTKDEVNKTNPWSKIDSPSADSLTPIKQKQCSEMFSPDISTSLEDSQRNANATSSITFGDYFVEKTKQKRKNKKTKTQSQDEFLINQNIKVNETNKRSSLSHIGKLLKIGFDDNKTSTDLVNNNDDDEECRATLGNYKQLILSNSIDDDNNYIANSQGSYCTTNCETSDNEITISQNNKPVSVSEPSTERRKVVLETSVQIKDASITPDNQEICEPLGKSPPLQLLNESDDVLKEEKYNNSLYIEIDKDENLMHSNEKTEICDSIDALSLMSIQNEKAWQCQEIEDELRSNNALNKLQRRDFLSSYSPENTLSNSTRQSTFGNDQYQVLEPSALDSVSFCFGEDKSYSDKHIDGALSNNLCSEQIHLDGKSIQGIRQKGCSSLKCGKEECILSPQNMKVTILQDETSTSLLNNRLAHCELNNDEGEHSSINSDDRNAIIKQRHKKEPWEQLYTASLENMEIHLSEYAENGNSILFANAEQENNPTDSDKVAEKLLSVNSVNKSSKILNGILKNNNVKLNEHMQMLEEKMQTLTRETDPTRKAELVCETFGLQGKQFIEDYLKKDHSTNYENWPSCYTSGSTNLIPDKYDLPDGSPAQEAPHKWTGKDTTQVWGSKGYLDDSGFCDTADDFSKLMYLQRQQTHHDSEKVDYPANGYDMHWNPFELNNTRQARIKFDESLELDHKSSFGSSLRQRKLNLLKSSQDHTPTTLDKNLTSDYKSVYLAGKQGSSSILQVEAIPSNSMNGWQEANGTTENYHIQHEKVNNFFATDFECLKRPVWYDVNSLDNHRNSNAISMMKSKENLDLIETNDELLSSMHNSSHALNGIQSQEADYQKTLWENELYINPTENKYTTCKENMPLPCKKGNQVKNGMNTNNTSVKPEQNLKDLSGPVSSDFGNRSDKLDLNFTNIKASSELQVDTNKFIISQSSTISDHNESIGVDASNYNAKNKYKCINSNNLQTTPEKKIKNVKNQNAGNVTLSPIPRLMDCRFPPNFEQSRFNTNVVKKTKPLQTKTNYNDDNCDKLIANQNVSSADLICHFLNGIVPKTTHMKPPQDLELSELPPWSKWKGMEDQLFKLLHAFRVQIKNIVMPKYVERFKAGTSRRGNIVFIGYTASNPDNQLVAVKRMSKTMFYSIKSQVNHLVNHLSKISHENLLSIMRYVEDDTNIYMISALCECNLTAYLQNLGPSEPGQNFQITLKISHQILKGLQHLHSNHISHSNLKPENVLIDTYGQVRLSDFSLWLPNNPQNDHRGGSNQWKSTDTIIKNSAVLSFETMAKADIQVAGMLLHYTLTIGQHPFGKSKWHIAVNIENKQRPKLQVINPEADDLIWQLLSLDSTKRPSAAEALYHPLFWEKGKAVTFVQRVATYTTRLMKQQNSPTTRLNSPGTVFYAHIQHLVFQDISGGLWKKAVPYNLLTDFSELRGHIQFGDDLLGLLEFVHTVHICRDFITENSLQTVVTKFPSLCLELYKFIKNQEPQLFCNSQLSGLLD